MANTRINSEKNSINDTPLSEQDRAVIYDLLLDLRATANKDPEAPPLEDLYAIVEFTVDPAGATEVDGTLLERKNLTEHLPPEVVEMVQALPKEANTWLLVVNHPQGTGVFNVRMPAPRDEDIQPPMPIVLQGDLAEPAPVERGLSSFEVMFEQLNKYLNVGRKQCEMMMQAVDGLCAQRLNLKNPPPTHELVAALRLDESGLVEGVLVEFTKMLLSVTPQTQRVLLEHKGRVPGKMLVMVNTFDGRGGVFAVVVNEIPSISAKGSQGVLN